MQGLGGLLCLATVAIEALLSVMAAALSGFGLFFRVSFRWGHDDLLRIVMSSIPTYMKETMSHLASISKRQTRGEDAPAPPSYKPFMMNGFHGVSSENPHQCLLNVMFGKASQELRGAKLPIDKPQTGHKGYLLLWEVQYTTNRDKLIRLGAGILGALAAALCPIKSQIGGALQ